MTGIRYRCEPSRTPRIGKPRIESASGASPVRAEVWRLAPRRLSARSAELSVPRTLTRPVRAPGGTMAHTAPAAATGAPNSVPASSGFRAQRALEGLRILIVEDDDDAREMVSIIFAHAGASVECAASAADGFRAFNDNPPQLLVSDIGMPDEDGYSLMRRIRALQCCQGGDVLAIALSAFTRPEDRMLALRAGFTLHIAKPVGPRDLVAAAATVAALIEHRGSRPNR
jgi:CheY-like chemotaxis protein